MAGLLTNVYSLGFVVLGLYGLRALILTIAYAFVRRRPEPAPPAPDVLPLVTVQLPIYNERYVATRLIDAVCRMRWPRERLAVQVLDDSDDDTVALIDACADAWRVRGADITVVRRDRRTGYKAGALAEGLAAAKGDILAVFDADFVPTPDFLHQTVPHLAPDVAMVQVRWGHLNADASAMTRVQALALDGHFVVEQTARARLGLLWNFNGTAGIWRREAIEQSGGWQDDTLSEDMDLSFRAQLEGWKMVFLPGVAVPAELPATMMAFKRQQRRWGQGITQVLGKLGRRVWRAPHPLWQRLINLLGLTAYLNHFIGLALFIGTPLLILYPPHFRNQLGWLWLLTLGPCFMCSVAAHELGGNWQKRLFYYPLLFVIAMGMSLNGTLSVLGALRGRGGVFQRTPKSGDGFAPEGELREGNVREGNGGVGGLSARRTAIQAEYVLGADWQVVAEAALAIYGWALLVLAIADGVTSLVILLALYALGFTLVALLSLEGGTMGLGLGRADSWSAEKQPL